MKPLRRMLVATDFSVAARAALDTALQLAAVSHADIDVLHVWQPTPGVSLNAPTPEANAKTLSEVARKQAARALNAWVGNARVHVRVELGAPAELIVTLAQRDHHDLIVLGTTGSGAAQPGLGSVALRVIGSAPCPVLALPGKDS